MKINFLGTNSRAKMAHSSLSINLLTSPPPEFLIASRKSAVKAEWRGGVQENSQSSQTCYFNLLTSPPPEFLIASRKSAVKAEWRGGVQENSQSSQTCYF